MQLIVIKHDSDALAAIEIPNDADTELLIQMIQSELGIPFNEQRLEFEDNRLSTGVLAAQGVVDGSTIIVKQVTAQPAGNAAALNPQALQPPSDAAGRQHELLDPSAVPPERMLEFVSQNPASILQYKRIDVELGTILEQRDSAKLRVWVMKRAMSRHKLVYEARQEEIALATADPMDPEVQRKIAERIRLQNVEENLNSAMENLPEAFGRVTMLYVHLQINGNPVKAFVDSGAQITIMSKRCADACNITHLIDTRMVSQLRGVGTSQTLGRIHAVQMKFGNSYMALSITVVPDNDMDFLFGLDNLRRLRGVIDLSRNVLCLDGASGREEVSFLGESELPEHAKGNYNGPDTPATGENAAGAGAGAAGAGGGNAKDDTGSSGGKGGAMDTSG